MPLTTLPFLPFTKGVIDSANSSLELTGAVRAMKGWNLIGANKLTTRAGDAVALTLKDDAGTPANVTSVCGVWQFKDRAVAIAHSTSTSKAYLYVLKSDLTDWYNGTTGALVGNTSPQPAVVIWTSITTAPDVFVAEGLGTLYIAHASGVDAAALNFATKSWNGSFAVALTTLTADLDTSGAAEDLYFNGVIAFQNHLWAWGFGAGTTATTGYDPSKARFSAPSFGAFAASDSITIGNKVKSDRERIISGGLAGNALILQGTYITSRVTGYGKSSWFRQIVDESNGIVGPKAGVSDGGYWYFWSPRGPCRIAESGDIEMLDEPVRALVASVVNKEKIVAGRDIDTSQVFFLVDTGSGVRTKVAYHTRRNVWITTSDDTGLAMRACGEVNPVVGSTSAAVSGPSGAPSGASTTEIGVTTAKANWTNGDSAASTQVEYRLQGATSWTVVTTVAAGVTSYTFSGLSDVTAYEWRVAHLKNGQYSSYLGPSASTRFTTSTTLLAPTNLVLSEVSITTVYATWTNSAESGTSTEVYSAGPSASLPADGDFVFKQNVGTGGSSATVTVASDFAGGTYWIRIKHTRSGNSSAALDNSITLS